MFIKVAFYNLCEAYENAGLVLYKERGDWVKEKLCDLFVFSGLYVPGPGLNLLECDKDSNYFK